MDDLNGSVSFMWKVKAGKNALSNAVLLFFHAGGGGNL